MLQNLAYVSTNVEKDNRYELEMKSNMIRIFIATRQCQETTNFWQPNIIRQNIAPIEVTQKMCDITKELDPK